MATFPLLRTGAVAQYPLEITSTFQTEAVQFLDGSRQRYRLMGASLRQWQISLDLLDDAEAGAVIGFVFSTGSSVFSFIDPVSGASVPKCVISGDRYQLTSKGEMQAGAKLLIQEIP